MMGKLLEQEWLRGVMFTLMALGLGVAALGGWQYFNAAQELSNNRAHQLREAGEDVPLETQTEMQSLFASDLRRNTLLDQQSNAMILAGGGLVLLALGWIGLDFIRSHKRRQAPPTPPAEPGPESATL